MGKYSGGCGCGVWRLHILLACMHRYIYTYEYCYHNIILSAMPELVSLTTDDDLRRNHTDSLFRTLERQRRNNRGRRRWTRGPEKRCQQTSLLLLGRFLDRDPKQTRFNPTKSLRSKHPFLRRRPHLRGGRFRDYLLLLGRCMFFDHLARGGS